MKNRLPYLYFIMAIAPFEALVGLSLQTIGSIIAYNLILAVIPLLISYSYYVMGSEKSKRASIIMLSLAIIKIASMTLLNFPMIIDAVIDGTLILTVVAAVNYLWPSKQSKTAVLLGVLGVGLVTLKIGAITIIGGLILESASLILAGAVVRLE